MDEIELTYRKFLTNFDFQAKSNIYTMKFQFEHWIRKIFFLNDALHKEYNLFYQDLFWVCLYQFFTEGEYYLRETKTIIDRIDEIYKKRFYNRLWNGMQEMKSQFKGNDFDYLRYRRHNVCHIFQFDYSVFNKDDSLKTIKGQTKKDKTIIDIEIEHFKVLEKYGSDEEYDRHYRDILYPIIDKLYNDLQAIHEEEKEAYQT